MNQSVEIFLNKKLIILKESDSAILAVNAMSKNQVDFIIVNTYNSEFAGIVTDRDLVFYMINGNFDIKIPLREIVKDSVIYLSRNSVIKDVINLMKENGSCNLPVIEEIKNGSRQCIGIVSLDDLIAGDFITTKDLSQIVRAQIVTNKTQSRTIDNEYAKKENSYMRFISRISIDINLERVKTTEVTKFLLSTLVNRLDYTAGIHFISKLPKYLQEYLLGLNPGPDKTINDKTIIQGISLRTGKDIISSKLIAQRFWKSLDKTLGKGEASHILNQFPDSIKNLFQNKITGLRPYSITDSELKEHIGS